MLLTAQRVLSPSGQEGVNAFCHLHGPYDWIEPPDGIPDTNPGECVNERIAVAPGGNRVRSYLDIIAPDDTATSEILATVRHFLAHVQESPLPWVETVGRCTFRFGLELGIEEQWTVEFVMLLEAAVLVRVPV